MLSSVQFRLSSEVGNVSLHMHPLYGQGCLQSKRGQAHKMILETLRPLLPSRTVCQPGPPDVI